MSSKERSIERCFPATVLTCAALFAEVWVFPRRRFPSTKEIASCETKKKKVEKEGERSNEFSLPVSHGRRRWNCFFPLCSSVLVGFALLISLKKREERIIRDRQIAAAGQKRPVALFTVVTLSRKKEQRRPGRMKGGEERSVRETEDAFVSVVSCWQWNKYGKGQTNERTRPDEVTE